MLSPSEVPVLLPTRPTHWFRPKFPPRRPLVASSSLDLAEVDSSYSSFDSCDEDTRSLISAISARSLSPSPRLPELDEEVLNILEQSRLKVFGPASASTTSSPISGTSVASVASTSRVYPPIPPIISGTAPSPLGVSQGSQPSSTVTSAAMLLIQQHHQNQTHQQRLFVH